VSINYRPDLTGIAVYSSGMAEYFAAAGHATTVHTGFSYYPTWVKRREDHARVFRSEHIEGVRVRRCYLYVPERPTALRRMLHEFSFVVCASVSYLLAARTDVTVIVSPPLLLGIPIALLARLKSSKTVFHVQDLQPDAAVDLQMLRPGLLTRLLFAIERWTYLLVDRVSTISCAMRAKIISKNIPPEKVWIFKNWANDEFLTGGFWFCTRGTWASNRDWGAYSMPRVC
jgi:colanic acid biosynthesis glycosyl transferase WcaI